MGIVARSRKYKIWMCKKGMEISARSRSNVCFYPCRSGRPVGREAKGRDVDGLAKNREDAREGWPC